MRWLRLGRTGLRSRSSSEELLGGLLAGRRDRFVVAMSYPHELLARLHAR